MRVFWNNYKGLFVVPLLIVLGILLYFMLNYIWYDQVAKYIIILTICIGSWQLVKDTYDSLTRGEFALDYIAILAILVGIISGQYIVAAIIVLMMAGGNTLEKYGVDKAKEALTWLVDRIPNEVTTVDKSGNYSNLDRWSVEIWSQILVRKWEVIPLDGILLSEFASVDESSLTGESYPQDHSKGNIIQSWTVNLSDPIILQVSKKDQDSTYNKIIQLVSSAQENKSPFIRLADKYSVVFTIATLLIAWFAYRLHADINYVLAVLVIATPCPLILATPIALMWWVNSAARKLIIVKNLTAIEAMSRVDSLMFDKTGTLTLGKPQVTNMDIYNVLENGDNLILWSSEIIAIAASIENNSTHPLAKAIVNYALQKQIKSVYTSNIKEIIWRGISGEYEWHIYILGKLEQDAGMSIGMRCDDVLIAKFVLEDVIKSDSADVVRDLIKNGLSVSMYTGDHEQAALDIQNQIDPSIKVVANCKPEDKQKGIAELHTQNRVVAMVGDGINDAPALAMADVGMVFSNNEQTATTEAADVVFLNGNFKNVSDVLGISRRSVDIAKQSILFGIWLSIIGMILAALGYISPVRGAGAQEVIDVIAILNALRSSRLN